MCADVRTCVPMYEHGVKTKHTFPSTTTKDSCRKVQGANKADEVRQESCWIIWAEI